jgi:hypothetical protein
MPLATAWQRDCPCAATRAAQKLNETASSILTHLETEDMVHDLDRTT